jgi:hypothetical protein
MRLVEDTIPVVSSRATVEAAALARCAELCFTCAAACMACAASCRAEKDTRHLKRCIRLAEDSADLCVTAGRSILRTFEPEPSLLRALLAACAWACELCAAECDIHADAHHACRACADACTACQRECRALLRALLTVPD